MQMMELPKGRLLEQRREIVMLIRKHSEDKNRVSGLIKSLANAGKRNQELAQMLKKVEDLRQQVFTKMDPYKSAVRRQQELIYRLYRQLGHT